MHDDDDIQPVMTPCPDATRLVLLAAGSADAAETDLLMEHVAACESCSDRLRSIVAGMSVEVGPKQGSGSALGRFRNWGAIAAVGLIAALGVGLWRYRAAQPTDENGAPFQLLASAYSAKRTMELRIPGAGHAPLRVDRAVTNIADMPPALLDSQLRIKNHLEKRPDDPVWLHAQGRVQLLLWQPEAAIKTFQAAQDLGYLSPDLLVDFGSAYFQRGEQNNSALDYAYALEKLGQALRQRPNDATSLFNRAILHEKLHQYESAIADFEACLQLEADSGWKAEVQGKLNEIRNRKARVLDPKARWKPEMRSELALEDAMAQGISGHFDGRGSSALLETADGMLRQHRDAWLKEVLALPSDSSLKRAVRAISGMTRLRLVVNGDYSSLDSEITWLQATVLPVQLKLWRDYELLYRNARTSAVKSLPSAEPLVSLAKPYPWFLANVLLETSLAPAARQDFSASSVLIDQAEATAQKSALTATLIRIPNFRGQRFANAGYYRDAIQVAVGALEQFQQGGYPLRRLNDFHAIILSAATQLNLPYTGLGSAKMIALAGEVAGIDMLVMSGNGRRAGFANLLGKPGEAQKAYQSAEAAVARLGNNKPVKLYWRNARLSWLEQQQNLAALYSLLDEAKAEGSTEGNLYFNRFLITAICRMESKLGHRAEVESLSKQFWEDALPHGSLPDKALRTELASISESLATVRAENGDAEGALDAWNRFHQVDQRLLGAENETVPSPARPIPPGSLRLVIAALGDKTAIWEKSSRGLQFHWAKAPSFDLIRHVRRLRRLCSTDKSEVSQIASEAKDLLGVLIPQGLDKTTKSIQLQARGELNTLPLAVFQLLPEARDVTFSFLPLGDTRTGWESENSQITVLAATSFDPKLSLPPLPGVDREIEGIRQVFGKVEVLERERVNYKVLEEAAKQPGILHFAGHATPWRGGVGLVVSKDEATAQSDGGTGIWTMGRPRTVRRSLVVFSACGTAEFEETATVQPGQLSSAALLAGAKRVVATLWNVDSSASSDWMKTFYGGLQKTHVVSTAAHFAALSVQSRQATSHPHYWAAYATYER
jgi:CHAT domain-containing protein/tetratricopeptide (TPR) repeat protein